MPDMRKNIYYLLFFLAIIFLPFFVSADTLGQTREFFIDSSYDKSGREKILASLKKVSLKAYFYMDSDWFNKLAPGDQELVQTNIEALSKEFDEKIYPTLTQTFGQEWAPGIDSDYNITILFHQIRDDAGGYFNNGDEYPKYQSPKSNEREIIYLNSQHIFFPIIKSYLAHEFLHLITFNQKERLKKIQEEVWLNEARAEYAPTLLGYDSEYDGSNLQQRVKQFILAPTDSLTEWQNQKADYGLVNVFTQYLVDQYGVRILADSLQSSKTGIASLNEALIKAGTQKDFSQVFSDWLAAIFLNNCKVSPRYCYKNGNLLNLRVAPSLIFLPSTQKTSVSLNYSTKEWQGSWYRIIGGEGDLKLEFKGQENVKFKVSYILCKDTDNCQVLFLSLDEKQKGEILLKDFSKNWTALIIIPSIQSKISNFGKGEPNFDFLVAISTTLKTEDEKTKEGLLAQIDFLKREIARIQEQLKALLAEKGQMFVCQRFDNNLYFGMQNNTEVSCLQNVLKDQGPEIYPEGLVTGNFFSVTRLAVIRFQEKYTQDILTPFGLTNGTGIVGPRTRAKLNQILIP